MAKTDVDTRIVSSAYHLARVHQPTYAHAVAHVRWVEKIRLPYHYDVDQRQRFLYRGSSHANITAETSP